MQLFYESAKYLILLSNKRYIKKTLKRFQTWSPKLLNLKFKWLNYFQQTAALLRLTSGRQTKFSTYIIIKAASYIPTKRLLTNQLKDFRGI